MTRLAEEDSRQWDAILADEKDGAVSDEDRKWWDDRTRPLDRYQQHESYTWHRIGYWDGFGGLPLSVVLGLKELPWCVDAYVRGYQRGQDEREVEETVAARERLPIDEGEAPERED